MVNIAICDDERDEIKYLTTLVRNWANERNISIRLLDYVSAENFLFLYEDEPADILLLDIQMSGMDGVSLAKKIRKTKKKFR